MSLFSSSNYLENIQLHYFQNQQEQQEVEDHESGKLDEGNITLLHNVYACVLEKESKTIKTKPRIPHLQ